MRKRVQIALAVLIVVLAGVSAWLGLREREPVYQIRSLNKWLEDYTPLPGIFGLGDERIILVRAGGEVQSYDNDFTKVDAAVRQIGANALPTLFRMLRAKDSALRLKLVRFAQKHPFIKMKYTTAESLNFRAVAGFRALGGEAKNAVPELIEMYKHSPGSGRWGPGAALGEIGPCG